MNYLDIIFFIFIAIAFILGFKDGFVRKLIGLVGFVLAVFLSIKFSHQAGIIVQNILGIEAYLSEIIGGFSIFIFIIVLTSVIKRVVHPFDKVNNLINRIVGGVTGVLQIIFFISAVLALLNIFGFPAEKERKASLLYEPFAAVIPKVVNYIQADASTQLRNLILEKDTIK